MLSLLARFAALFALGALAACVAETGPTPSLPPLAQDRDRPALALVEHVLDAHFAGPGAGADPPTICVALSPVALSAEDEQALIARFPRLAPRDRCDTNPPPPEDGITGERAVMVQVYSFGCTSADTCEGWVSRPGQPSTRYTMRYADGAWQFEGNRRLLAE